MSTMQAGVINPVSWRGGLKGIPVLLTFRALLVCFRESILVRALNRFERTDCLHQRLNEDHVRTARAYSNYDLNGAANHKYLKVRCFHAYGNLFVMI